MAVPHGSKKKSSVRRRLGRQKASLYPPKEVCDAHDGFCELQITQKTIQAHPVLNLALHSLP